MDDKIIKTAFFGFLMCLSVIVPLTCAWKLMRLIARIKMEQRIEDLESLEELRNNSKLAQQTKEPGGSSPIGLQSMTAKEAKILRRLSVLAGREGKRPQSISNRSSSLASGMLVVAGGVSSGKSVNSSGNQGQQPLQPSSNNNNGMSDSGLKGNGHTSNGSSPLSRMSTLAATKGFPSGSCSSNFPATQSVGRKTGFTVHHASSMEDLGSAPSQNGQQHYREAGVANSPIMEDSFSCQSSCDGEVVSIPAGAISSAIGQSRSGAIQKSLIAASPRKMRFFDNRSPDYWTSQRRSESRHQKCCNGGFLDVDIEAPPDMSHESEEKGAAKRPTTSGEEVDGFICKQQDFLQQEPHSTAPSSSSITGAIMNSWVRRRSHPLYRLFFGSSSSSSPSVSKKRAASEESHSMTPLGKMTNLNQGSCDKATQKGFDKEHRPHSCVKYEDDEGGFPKRAGKRRKVYLKSKNGKNKTVSSASLFSLGFSIPSPPPPPKTSMQVEGDSLSDVEENKLRCMDNTDCEDDDHEQETAEDDLDSVEEEELDGVEYEDEEEERENIKPKSDKAASRMDPLTKWSYNSLPRYKHCYMLSSDKGYSKAVQPKLTEPSSRAGAKDFQAYTHHHHFHHHHHHPNEMIRPVAIVTAAETSKHSLPSGRDFCMQGSQLLLQHQVQPEYSIIQPPHFEPQIQNRSYRHPLHHRSLAQSCSPCYHLSSCSAPATHIAKGESGTWLPQQIKKTRSSNAVEGNQICYLYRTISSPVISEPYRSAPLLNALKKAEDGLPYEGKQYGNEKDDIPDNQSDSERHRGIADKRRARIAVDHDEDIGSNTSEEETSDAQGTQQETQHWEHNKRGIQRFAHHKASVTEDDGKIQKQFCHMATSPIQISHLALSPSIAPNSSSDANAKAHTRNNT